MTNIDGSSKKWPVEKNAFIRWCCSQWILADYWPSGHTKPPPSLWQQANRRNLLHLLACFPSVRPSKPFPPALRLLLSFHSASSFSPRHLSSGELCMKSGPAVVFGESCWKHASASSIHSSLTQIMLIAAACKHKEVHAEGPRKPAKAISLRSSVCLCVWVCVPECVCIRGLLVCLDTKRPYPSHAHARTGSAGHLVCVSMTSSKSSHSDWPVAALWSAEMKIAYSRLSVSLKHSLFLFFFFFWAFFHCLLQNWVTRGWTGTYVGQREEAKKKKKSSMQCVCVCVYTSKEEKKKCNIDFLLLIQLDRWCFKSGSKLHIQLKKLQRGAFFSRRLHRVANQRAFNSWLVVKLRSRLYLDVTEKSEKTKNALKVFLSRKDVFAFFFICCPFKINIDHLAFHGKS